MSRGSFPDVQGFAACGDAFECDVVWRVAVHPGTPWHVPSAGVPRRKRLTVGIGRPGPGTCGVGG